MPGDRRRVAAFCPLCVSRCGCEAVVDDGRLVANRLVKRPAMVFDSLPVLCRGAEVEAGARSSYKGKQSPARPPQVTFLPTSIEPPDGYWFGVAFHCHLAQRSCCSGGGAERCHH